jgi:hypothetical protein
MAITYPVNIPNHNFQSISMRLVRAVSMTESAFTLQQQVFQYDGARWQMEITLPPLTYADARQWEAFILSLRGMRGTFLMGNPLHTQPTGTATTVLLNGQATVRSTSIAVDGSTQGSTLKAGDYFQIGSGNDAHIHQVAQDATFNASSQATLDIEPPLRTTYANNTTLDFTLPKGVWRLASNDIGWSVDQASIHGFTIPCVEAL